MKNNYLCKRVAAVRLFIFLHFMFWSALPVCAENESGGGQLEYKDSQALNKWRNLSEKDKKILKERHQEWKDMDGAYKERIKKRHEQFKNLSSEQQQEIKEKWKRYKLLPKDQQLLIKERYRRWKNLPRQKKQELKERYRRLQKMSVQQRQKVIEKKKKWQQLSTDQKLELKFKYRDRKNYFYNKEQFGDDQENRRLKPGHQQIPQEYPFP